MLVNTVDTVQVRAYTPAGFQVYVTFAMANAGEIDQRLETEGYLPHAPGAEPGEVVEIMTHVCRRMHTNKKDGRITPVLAFYHENSALNFKYDHVYMNSPEEIAEFEQLSGIKMMSIPEYDSDQFLDRTSAKADKYIIKLPHAIKIAAADKPYTKLDGTEGITKKIQRFIGRVGEAAPQATPQATAQGEQWMRDIESLTKDLYIGSDGKYNPFHHNGSIQKALENGTITRTQNAILAASMLFLHRAETEYSYSKEDIQEVLGCEFGEWLKSGKTIAQAWQTIRDEFKADLPPTGTDDNIPF
jgi:hypothetical protein